MHDFTDKLTIGVRLVTRESHKESFETLRRDSAKYLDFLRILSPKRIVGVTIKGDSFETLLKQKCEKVESLDTEEFGFAKPMEVLYKQAKDDYLLVITMDIGIRPWQLQHAFEVLVNEQLLSIGWKILQQKNDGSYLGKMSYNTCQLYAPGFYKICDEVGGIPAHVESGALGTLDIHLNGSDKSIPLGGQEDLALQLKIFKKYGAKGKKLFGHIKHYGLSSPEKASLDVTNKEKLFRKIAVAEIYRGIEDVDATDFLNLWLVM